MAAAVVLALAGCGGPQAAPPDASPRALPGGTAAETAPGPVRPAVTVTDGTVEVAGVQPDGPLWTPDGSRVVCLTADGLWAVNPDGGGLEPWVAAPAPRRLSGWAGGDLIYLEQRGSRTAVMRLRPGESPTLMATVDGELPWWQDLTGSRLTLAWGLQKPRQVDLATGKVAELGDEPVLLPNGRQVLSPDKRHLAYMEPFTVAPVRVLDLETGAVARTEGEAHSYEIGWSPAGDRWAVLAAEPKEGVQRYDVLTHLDLGDPDGQVTHLRPPEPLQLIEGPFWSPDGRRLAVSAWHVPRGSGRQMWLVDAGTGRWTAGPVSMGGLSGWQPDGAHLLVGGPHYLAQVPADGGPMETLPLATARTPLPDGSALYFTEARDGRFLLVRERSGQEPATLWEGGWSDSIAVHDRNAAFITREEHPRLIIVTLK